VKVPAKTTLRGVLADVDEAAGARELRPEPAHVHVALGVALGHPEARHVEAAAVVEIELLVLVQDRLGVDRRAEVEPRLRHAADHARLGGKREVVEDAFLVGHGRYPLGHADAEIHDAAHGELERRTPGDHLALVEGKGGQHVERDLELARERRVVCGAVRLVVRFGTRDHGAIDHHPGDDDVPGIERAGRRDPLDLGDHESARVLGRRGDRQVVEDECLVLHGDVAERSAVVPRRNAT
jgi:hypothetical protein